MEDTRETPRRQRVPIGIVVRQCGQTVGWYANLLNERGGEIECGHAAVLFCPELNGSLCRFCADTMPEFAPFVEIERAS